MLDTGSLNQGMEEKVLSDNQYLVLEKEWLHDHLEQQNQLFSDDFTKFQKSKDYEIHLLIKEFSAK